MRVPAKVLALCLAGCALPAAVSGGGLVNEQEFQRALIQRDQQSAEFALRLRGAPLEDLQRMENLSARQQLMVEKRTPQELRPYERHKAAEERTLVLTPPTVRAQAPAGPRPLPAQPPCGVKLVPADGVEPPTNGLQNRCSTS